MGAGGAALALSISAGSHGQHEGARAPSQRGRGGCSLPEPGISLEKLLGTSPKPWELHSTGNGPGHWFSYLYNSNQSFHGPEDGSRG